MNWRNSCAPWKRSRRNCPQRWLKPNALPQQLKAQLAQHRDNFSLEEVLHNEATLGLEEP